MSAHTVRHPKGCMENGRVTREKLFEYNNIQNRYNNIEKKIYEIALPPFSYCGY